MPMDIIEVQTRLKTMGLYQGQIGASAAAKATDDAMMALFRFQKVTGWDFWNTARRVIASGQIFCRMDGIDPGEIDGLRGPQTDNAFTIYDARMLNGGRPVPAEETWRDVEDAKPPAPTVGVSNTAWPLQSGVSKFFGAIGQNQTTLVFPYPMRLAWDVSKKVTKTSCHEKVHDAAKRILTRVFDHYDDMVFSNGLDLFGGCLNVRKMRGGSAWSMHSWGIAFDFDPEHNQLKWGMNKARFGKPEYVKWFDLWQEEGAVSLLRARNFDGMHTQFARV